MSLLTNKRVLLAEAESSYGVDPTPTGSANAMLVRNLSITPLDGERVSRDLIRPYFGNSEELIATNFVRLEFEVELQGTGVIGKSPSYDCLLRACGFSGAAATTSISIAVASAVATVTKASHGLSTGDKVIVSGCTDTALNIEATITVTGANTFTYAAAGAADDPSADGTPVMRTAYTYSPVSTSIGSVAFYYNVDGVLHKALGSRGSFELSMNVRQIPIYKFTFVGLFSSPSDVAAPTPDFSGFMTPQLVNTQNTPGFTIHGYSGIMENFSMNLANDVQYLTYVGSESVKVLNRRPTGTFSIEAPTITSKDFFSIASAGTKDEVEMIHGETNGKIVTITMPKVSIGNPEYQDSNGVQFLSLPFIPNPDAGNDEITIAYS